MNWHFFFFWLLCAMEGGDDWIIFFCSNYILCVFCVYVSDCAFIVRPCPDCQPKFLEYWDCGQIHITPCAILSDLSHIWKGFVNPIAFLSCASVVPFFPSGCPPFCHSKQHTVTILNPEWHKNIKTWISLNYLFFVDLFVNIITVMKCNQWLDSLPI